MKTAFYLGLLCLGLATPLAAVRASGRLDSLGAGKRFASSRRESGKKDRYSLVVAADGTGDFTSVQQAIDHVPEYNMHRFVIHIKPGTYKEQVKLSQTKPFITLQGEDALKTTLTFNLSATISGDTRLSYSTYVGSSDFRAENLTFENTCGTGSQAVAVYVNTDRAVFRNCRFLGWQDTLFAHGGRQYYKDCYVEGHVDFIFGNATAVFESCHIHSKGQGYVTAHWCMSDAETNGYVFLHCKLTGAETGKGVYLGRPWRPYGRVVFIECWMDAHIKPEGWDNWRDPAREKTARFAEYKSSGPGANPSARVPWSRQLNEEEIQSFATKTFLRGVDGWNPTKW
ncbi:MAG TPA: pectinesterase family protein [Pyrinomonadaceae bacterium]|nr:pectinesterase family protein [Pyrinomonadaceae bacterium]